MIRDQTDHARTAIMPVAQMFMIEEKASAIEPMASWEEANGRRCIAFGSATAICVRLHVNAVTEGY